MIYTFFRKFFRICPKLRRIFYSHYNKLLFWANGIQFGRNMQVLDKMYVLGKGKVNIGDDFRFTSGDSINPICRNIRGAIYTVTPLSRIEIGNRVGISSACLWAHTLTHPMLRRVENSYEEIRKSKENLEQILHKSISYFAYPYGRQSSVSHRIMKEAKQSGFYCAFVTIQAPLSDISRKSIFYLPRMVYKGGNVKKCMNIISPYLIVSYY